MANFDQDHGVIAQLINLPEDDAGRRFLAALMASLGLNAAAIIAVNVVSQLHSDLGKEKPRLNANVVDLVFDDPKQIQPEVKPQPEPTPKPTPRPKVKRINKLNKLKVRRNKVRPPVKIKQEKPRPQPTPKPEEPNPEPTPEPTKPEVQPEPKPVKPTVKNTATERVASNQQATTAANNTARSTNLAPGSVGQPTLNPSTAARIAANAGTALRSGEVSTSVSATTAGRGVPTNGGASLATGGFRSSVAATNERSESANVASTGGGATSLYRPTDIVRRSNVSGATGGAVRGGSSGFSTATGNAALASISAPSFVGRRGPAIGNTSLTSDNKAVLTSVMTDEGRANSGLATIQGARGTVATSVAVGQTGVSGQSAGRAGVGGGRHIGGSSEAVASISGLGGTSGARGPVTGAGRLADSLGGRGNVGEASEGSGRGTGVAGAGNASGAAGTAGKLGGGGGGPRTVAGVAGGGGGGGASVRAGGAEDAKVEAKNGPTEEKKPTNTGNKDVVKAGSGDGTKLNQDAEPIFEPLPELTAEMKKRPFNANIRVRVTVDADGSHEEELTQGTGDSEIDALVIKTMRRWKWRPAYRDGEKVKTTRPYRFRININD